MCCRNNSVRGIGDRRRENMFICECREVRGDRDRRNNNRGCGCGRCRPRRERVFECGCREER